MFRFNKETGEIESHVLGPDLAAGQRLQVFCPGDTWKIDSLADGHGPEEWTLWSECVVPGR